MHKYNYKITKRQNSNQPYVNRNLLTRNNNRHGNINSLTCNQKEILHFAANYTLPNTTVSLDKILDTIQNNKLANIANTNVWEFPHLKGLCVHTVNVNLLSRILSDKILSTFDENAQNIILQNLDSIFYISSTYMQMHDIGKLAPEFTTAANIPDKVKRTNKDIEKLYTIISIYT